jgi:hypothetical protein
MLSEREINRLQIYNPIGLLSTPPSATSESNFKTTKSPSKTTAI